MMTLQLHEIILAKTEEKMILYFFEKKTKKMVKGEDWDFPGIFEIQTIVNNFFFIVTKDSKFGIYCINET